MVYVCFDLETAKRRFAIDDPSLQSGFAAQVSDSKGEALLMCVPEQDGFLNIGTTSHECYHIADMIFEQCGVEYKEHSGNEHMAYLLDWLVEKTFDCIEIERQFIERNGKEEPYE